MSRIEVDLAQLRAAAGGVADAVAVAREVRRGAGSLRGLAAGCGDDRLTGAVEEFLSAWEHGAGLLVEDGEAFGRLLRGAAETYADADRAAAGLAP